MRRATLRRPRHDKFEAEVVKGREKYVVEILEDGTVRFDPPLHHNRSAEDFFKTLERIARRPSRAR
jgi:hypothetical protein